jgi:predicted PurR-regulated permease PerM
MFVKVRNWLQEFRLSLKMKLTLALSAIAVVLLMSSIISVLEYQRMSNYVSDMMADNVRNIHVTQELVNAVDTYNLQLLAVIGDDSLSSLPDFDRQAFLNHCDSLRISLGASRTVPLTDSVLYAYSAYMLASLELEDVLESSFINTRDWYFNRLQPLFSRMRGYLDRLSGTMYEELEQNARDFDSGFSRSIIPGIVAVSVGILLVLLLLFYILVYYVKPIYRMRDNLDEYLSYRKRYSYTFDGNDQLSDLNASVTDLTEENRQLRRRISDLKEKQP